MEYLQYSKLLIHKRFYQRCFKPYYKWNTFNTRNFKRYEHSCQICFKPYYKWNTFNTKVLESTVDMTLVDKF